MRCVARAVLVGSVELCAISHGATITVDLSGAGDHRHIQAAIDSAGNGDTVLVAPGEYVIFRPLRFNARGSAEVKDLVLRSEAGPEDTAIRMASASPDPEVASVVIFDQGETEESVIDGFTITGGRQNDDGLDSSSMGGGIRILNGSRPVIRNCRITGNSAKEGGGIYCSGAGAVLQDCRITDNTSEFGDGGGVLCLNSTMTFDRCVIARNAARVNCIHPRCLAALGGGLSVLFASNVTVSDSTIEENVAESEGGGIYTSDGDVVLEVARTAIRRNFSPRGGGLRSCCNASVTFTDCVFAGNWAQRGGAIQGNPILNRCTVVGNTGGAITGRVELSHSIVWHNTGGSVPEDLGIPAVYSCVETEEVLPGEGNINEDPLFCGWGEADEVFVDGSGDVSGKGGREDPYTELRDALEYDFRLSEASPCLGGGEDGSDIGATTGRCGTPGAAVRTVSLAQGVYAVEGISLAYGASLEGAGPDRTRLEGSVLGLRTGTTISGLTVTGGLRLGGIRIDAGESPTVTGCVLRGNLATNTSGGGVFCGPFSAPLIRDCTILSNRANEGGAIACFESSVTVESCELVGNSSNSRGAAVYCGADTSVVLRNCLLAGNFRSSLSSAHGTSVFCGTGSSAVFRNCTIADNFSRGPNSSVLYFDRFATGLVFNTIVWNEDRLSIGSQNQESFPEVLYSSVRVEGEPLPGAGNRNSVPRFARAGSFDFERSMTVFVSGHDRMLPDFVLDAGDYRLRRDSPLIDAGSAEKAPEKDLDGNKRPCGAGIDVGAYEACLLGEADFLRGDADAEGDRVLTDVIVVLQFLFLGGDRPGCLDSADMNDDGHVDCSDPIHLLNVLFLSSDLMLAEPDEACGPDPTPDDVTCLVFPLCE